MSSSAAGHGLQLAACSGSEWQWQRQCVSAVQVNHEGESELAADCNWCSWGEEGLDLDLDVDCRLAPSAGGRDLGCGNGLDSRAGLGDTDRAESGTEIDFPGR